MTISSIAKSIISDVVSSITSIQVIIDYFKISITTTTVDDTSVTIDKTRV